MIYYNYPSYYYSPLPYQARRKYSTSNNSNYKKHYTSSSQAEFKKQVKENCQSHSKIEHQTSKENKNIFNSSNDETFFEIFGIKLYFDDILLICLIFFLYKEGVQDQYLFIALILLLLS